MTNEQIIYQTATSAGIPSIVANIMVSQAKFESANFTNNAFVKHNNAFGYKRHSGSQWQTGSGNTSSEGDAYADYKSLADSTMEVVSWLKRRQDAVGGTEFPNGWKIADLNTPEKYTYAIKNNKHGAYFGGNESSYASGLTAYLKKIAEDTVEFTKRNWIPIVASVILIGAGITFLFYERKKIIGAVDKIVK